MEKSLLTVQKYGGATLASPEKILAVAQKIAQRVQQGEKILCVVSAMGSTTNDLLHLAHAITSKPQKRELDMLLSTGERISASLLALALEKFGVSAVSFTGSQAGVLTDESHFNARIEAIKAPRIEEAVAKGQVCVVAGYQGVSPKTKDITTLGRGGTDVSALALAISLKAQKCEILKDVDGVFNTDPKFYSDALCFEHVSYEELRTMAFWGAKMIHFRAADLAAKFLMPLFIGSYVEPIGTQIISNEELTKQLQMKGVAMENPAVRSIQKLNSAYLILQSFENVELPEDAVLLLQTNSASIAHSPTTELKHFQDRQIKGAVLTLTGFSLERNSFQKELLAFLKQEDLLSTQTLFWSQSQSVHFFVTNENADRAHLALSRHYLKDNLKA